MGKSITVSVAIILLSFTASFSHGLEIEVVLSFPSVISTSMHSAEEPAKGIMITVFSPSDKTNTYQTGQTDPMGRFTFLPDAEGTWVIIADDGHGHKEESEVIVNADFFQPKQDEQKEIPSPVVVPAESAVQEMPKIYKMLMGLSLLFGITGIYYGYKVKQSFK